jgi:hypothetical protein
MDDRSHCSLGRWTMDDFVSFVSRPSSFLTPRLLRLELFRSNLVRHLVFVTAPQVFPDHPDPLEILLAVFPRLEVAHGDAFRVDISLLLQVIELVSRDIEFADDFGRFHEPSPQQGLNQ